MQRGSKVASVVLRKGTTSLTEVRVYAADAVLVVLNVGSFSNELMFSDWV